MDGPRPLLATSTSDSTNLLPVFLLLRLVPLLLLREEKTLPLYDLASSL
jgi:hypothetical protein